MMIWSCNYWILSDKWGVDLRSPMITLRKNYSTDDDDLEL